MHDMNDGIAIRAVRYRVLVGSPRKGRELHRLAGACRHVWNEMLDQQDQLRVMARMNGGTSPSPTFFTLGKGFTELRKSSSRKWLQDLSYKVVRYALKYQADAWSRFFSKEGGRPKFHSRGRSTPSFTIPDDVRIEDGKVHVPKIGWFMLRRRGGNPHPDGIPKQAVFKNECGKWHCTVFYAVEADPVEDNGIAVGIDRNVGQCALSSGEILRQPNVEKLEARRKRYQRRMARQVKGSNRRNRTKAKLARTSRKIADVRANWSHRVSRNIADRAGTAVVEKLNTKGMTRSAKGTVEDPGRNVKQKSGLNRAILSSGWGLLERNLAYKCASLVKVNPAYTSQTCHSCGTVDADSRINQSTFRCRACGHKANADVNASRNILASGIGATGRGGAFSLETPTIRQMGGENTS